MLHTILQMLQTTLRILQEVALEGPTGKIKQHRQNDPETGDTVSAGNATHPQQATKPLVTAHRHRWHDNVPWASAILCKVCASFLAVGCWLLFATKGIQGNQQ